MTRSFVTVDLIIFSMIFHAWSSATHNVLLERIFTYSSNILIAQACSLSYYERLQCLQAWGRMEAKTGNFGKARELFSAAVKIDQNDFMLLSAWGFMEIQSGKSKAAVDLLSRAHKLAPSDTYIIQVSWSSFHAFMLSQESILTILICNGHDCSDCSDPCDAHLGKLAITFHDQPQFLATCTVLQHTRLCPKTRLQSHTESQKGIAFTAIWKMLGWGLHVQLLAHLPADNGGWHQKCWCCAKSQKDDNAGTG